MEKDNEESSESLKPEVTNYIKSLYSSGSVPSSIKSAIYRKFKISVSIPQINEITKLEPPPID